MEEVKEENEESSGGNVRVVCRFRPLNEKELQSSESVCVEISPDNKNLTMISSTESNDPLKFSFDYIFGVNSHQQDVYEISAKPIVEAVMQGFNGTVFAYGQTSSGKTYTMTGVDLNDSNLMGVIPRMVTTVFDSIAISDPHIEYAVKVSYCEIYLEKIKDLLDISKTNLKVHEDKTRGVFIAELTERYVATDSEVYEIMKFGLDNRNVGSTNMNAVSSRSHSIFLITISQTNNRDYIAKTGKLYLVDLAGSEKVGKTGAAGKRLEEAKNINKSLTMLGLVIYSLTDGKSTHIPYRDSKLTRVLQDSLGGNSKTALIITCSPSIYNEAETISTLRFGMRAKAIKNTPKINREYTVAELKLILSKCREEMVKKDRRITGLEDMLKKSGTKIPAFKEDFENEEKIEEEKTEDYDEIVSEIEEYRARLAEETKATTKIKYEYDELLNEYIQAKKKYEIVLIDNKSMKEKIDDYEQGSGEKDSLIERLVTTKELLESERYNLNQKLLDLEKSLSEKEAEIINSVKNLQKHDPKNNFNSIKDLLKTEREVNIGYQKEIQQLRQNLNDLLNKKCPDFKIEEIVKEEMARKERDKWIDEKKSMLKDIQNRVNKVIELENELDDSRDSYRTLETYMDEGGRSLKKKNDYLERNLEQLTLMYHQLVSQKSHLDIEKKLADKKIQRNVDKIKQLEQDVLKYKLLYEEADLRLNQYSEENIHSSKMVRSSIGVGNIKVTIKGGNNSSKRPSLLNKNPFTIEEIES